MMSKAEIEFRKRYPTACTSPRKMFRGWLVHESPAHDLAIGTGRTKEEAFKEACRRAVPRITVA